MILKFIIPIIMLLMVGPDTVKTVERMGGREEMCMDAEAKMFQDIVGVSNYASEGTVSTLHDVGCGEIKDVILVSSKRGYTVKVIDEDNNVYFAGLGGLGYVEVIRRDSEDGELVYAAID